MSIRDVLASEALEEARQGLLTRDYSGWQRSHGRLMPLALRALAIWGMPASSSLDRLGKTAQVNVAVLELLQKFLHLFRAVVRFLGERLNGHNEFALLGTSNRDQDGATRRQILEALE